jgi:stage II sporulation protein D
VLVTAGCSLTRTRPAPATGEPASRPTPSSGGGKAAAAPAIPHRKDEAPSGTLLSIGLKSDASEIVLPPPGQRWILSSGGREEVLRGPLRFRSQGRGSSSWQVQAGAFSQEDPARAALSRLTAELGATGSVAFSADRGVYRVLLGSFPDRASADALAVRIRASGQDAFPVEGGAAAAGGSLEVVGEDGAARTIATPVDVYAFDPDARVVFEGKPYRGSLRLLANPRGTLNLVNRLDLEEYLYGVVPAEMGPKRYDELEALKAQAVAARTYALAHRRQFEAEGYDLCATPKCQVYAGLSAEDPLSTAAVDATRGLVLSWNSRFADALFVSTCGGRTENVENVFGDTPEPYLVSVECGELDTTTVAGARVAGRPVDRSGLQWRGYVLARHAPRRRASRAAMLETAQDWAGVPRRGGAPATLSPATVYPSLIATFGLESSRSLHGLPREADYFSEAPAASGTLGPAAREAYDFLLRFRFGAGESLPPADHRLDEEEYGGLLFSAGLRLTGITESSGKFLRREGSNLWVKTAEGRQGLPVDPELPLARRIGDRFYASSALILRAGDRLRWWKRGTAILALWVELDAAGPSFERDSSWTEWIRRVSARELARRMASRVPGTEVREIAVTRRSPSGRAIQMRVTTDAGEATLQKFDVRQALELPELLFDVVRGTGPQGEREFVFLGRGWGHGVGLCQNGAYGMALAGAPFDRILRHYYIGVDIVSAAGVTSGPPSSR